MSKNVSTDMCVLQNAESQLCSQLLIHVSSLFLGRVTKGPFMLQKHFGTVRTRIHRFSTVQTVVKIIFC